MATSTETATDADDLLSVRMTRILPVPRERVFAAWTTAELLQKWWGPKELVGLSAEADPRPGGAFGVEVQTPDGVVHHMRGIYTEVEWPSLVCIEIRHRQFEGASERPEGYIPTTVRVELREHKDGTELILAHTGFLDAAIAGRFNNGWSGAFDKLHAILANTET
jgi:uncharacterized protein YndB with AHSA1/START domain